jgi:hypothetical protein
MYAYSQKGINCDETHFSILKQSDSLKIDYPISLTDDSLFTSAIYREYCELRILIRHITLKLSLQQVNMIFNEEKRYFVLSADDMYIRYAFLRKSDYGIYAKYIPIQKDDNNMVITFRRTETQKKLLYWVKQEIEKGLIVSIIGKNRRTYICKSFKSL